MILEFDLFTSQIDLHNKYHQNMKKASKAAFDMAIISPILFFMMVDYHKRQNELDNFDRNRYYGIGGDSNIYGYDNIYGLRNMCGSGILGNEHFFNSINSYKFD